MHYSFDLLIRQTQRAITCKFHTLHLTNILSLDIIPPTTKEKVGKSEWERNRAWGMCYRHIWVCIDHFIRSLVSSALMWRLNMFRSTGGDSVCAYAKGIRTDREAMGCTALYPPARVWLSHLEANTHTHTQPALFSGWDLLNILSLSHYCFDPCQEQWAQTAGK